MKKITAMMFLMLAANAAMAAQQAINFNQADANRDGAITRDEAASFAALEQAFETADTNSNGLIELQEFTAIDLSAEAAGESGK